MLALWILPALTACKEPPPDERRMEPMQEPVTSPPPSRPSTTPDSGPDSGVAPQSIGADEGHAEVGTRPPADPEIERALTLVRDSGLRFAVPASSPEQQPAIYTAEQFAGTLRSKWDWIGYDIVELEPWLDQIATKTFKDNLPYQVLTEDGSSSDFRPWLDAALKAAPTPEPSPGGTP